MLEIPVARNAEDLGLAWLVQPGELFSPPQQSAGMPPARDPETVHLLLQELGPIGCSHSLHQQLHRGNQTHTQQVGQMLQNLQKKTWSPGLKSQHPLPQYRVHQVEELTHPQHPDTEDEIIL